VTGLRCPEFTQFERRRPGVVTSAVVSTRRLIIVALICGLAILVAFAVQAAQIMN
jgi:hypothetical protein